MAVFEMADQPLPLSFCGTERTAGDHAYVCIQKPCDGEHHYFVQANGSTPPEASRGLSGGAGAG